LAHFISNNRINIRMCFNQSTNTMVKRKKNTNKSKDKDVVVFAGVWVAALTYLLKNSTVDLLKNREMVSIIKKISSIKV